MLNINTFLRAMEKYEKKHGILYEDEDELNGVIKIELPGMVENAVKIELPDMVKGDVRIFISDKVEIIVREDATDEA